jgi:hypothetical protein
MLQLRNTRLYKSLFETLANGVAIQEEGVALTYVKEDGTTKVQIGEAGGRFAGIAMARNMPPQTVPLVESGVIPSAASGTLTRTPVVGQLLVKIGGAVATIVTGAPNQGEVNVTGNQYVANSADAGATISFQYLYVPTVAEARTLLGDLPYGGLAANSLGTVAAIKQGEVATSFFDASVDWSDTTYAKLADGGKFTAAKADGSDAMPNVTVKNSPNASNPFLVLSINVG